MAAISITPASVLKGTGAQVQNVIWGGTVTAGMSLYEKADGTFAGADCDLSLLAATCAGIALTGGASGQPGIMQTAGDIAIGGTVVVGTTYYVGDDAGEIFVASDLAAGDYVSIVGVGISATTIRMGRVNSGVTVPA